LRSNPAGSGRGMLDWRQFGRRIRETAHLMVGVPDYERYVAHCRRRHPDRKIMDRTEFMLQRMEQRYGGKGGASRCC
jgi:uncharacterized short protein YbdD (DUF466 family)